MIRATRWLPPACLPLIKSKPSAKDMPFKLTKARDSLRKLHDRHLKSQGRFVRGLRERRAGLGISRGIFSIQKDDIHASNRFS